MGTVRGIRLQQRAGEEGTKGNSGTRHFVLSHVPRTQSTIQQDLAVDAHVFDRLSLLDSRCECCSNPARPPNLRSCQAMRSREPGRTAGEDATPTSLRVSFTSGRGRMGKVLSSVLCCEERGCRHCKFHAALPRKCALRDDTEHSIPEDG